MTSSKPPHPKPSRVLRKEVVRLQQASFTRMVMELQEAKEKGIEPIFLGQRKKIRLRNFNPPEQPNVKKG